MWWCTGSTKCGRGWGGGGERACRGGNRACRHELLPAQIDSHVQAFEAVCAEENHVAVLREYDDRRGRAPAGIEQDESNVPLEDAAVCCLELVDSDGRHAEIDQQVARNPIVLAACVDHDAGKLTAAIRRS